MSHEKTSQNLEVSSTFILKNGMIQINNVDVTGLLEVHGFVVDIYFAFSGRKRCRRKTNFNENLTEVSPSRKSGRR